MTFIKKYYKHILVLLLVAYMSFSLIVYTFPDLFLYHPDPVKPDLAPAQEQLPGLQEVSYKTGDGVPVYAWYDQPQNAQRAVIFFHGNSYNLAYFIPRIRPFFEKGYAVIMPEFAGFGGLEGRPSQDNMEQTVLATVSFLNDQGFENKDIILYGYSLGTYMAVYGAAKAPKDDPFNAVVLEAPFTSVANVADEASFHLFPVHFLIRDHYDSASLIHGVNTRLFVAHGTQDQTVPYHQGAELFKKAAGNKVFYSVDGANHQSLPANGFFDEVLKWLKTN